MADQNDAEKTEKPTAKKLSDARKKGNIARSQEVNSWAA
ncbi:MAG: EscU/YscU/HrcU family type III secretion system export apparatus switch protein, partial [Rhodospirillales bacterium]